MSYYTLYYPASTGGLLGLCLGVSALSAIEALYHCTLRLFWKLGCGKRITKTKIKKFAEILKRKMYGKENQNVKNKFLTNNRAFLRRVNEGTEFP